MYGHCLIWPYSSDTRGARHGHNRSHGRRHPSNRATAQHILKNMKLFQEINLSSCRENVNLFVFYLYGVIRKLHVELFGGLEDLF